MTVTADLRVFTSYAHEDEPYRKQLQEHLAALERRGLIKLWSDHDILAGQSWSVAIQQELDQAHLIVLLVSSAFINSDFCWREELARALQRSQTGEAHVIPVLVRPVAWARTPLAELQAVPSQPITLAANHDEAWVQVVDRIEEVVETLRQRLTGAAPQGWARWPHPLARVVGRDRELSDVRRLLAGGSRLVTVVGPAGVGKTLLALHAGLGLESAFPGGACRVALTDVTEPALVESEIARALGLTEAGRPLRERLREVFGDRKFLVLLDGFERLVGATPVLCDLLESTPGLHVLVTSRQALRQPGEAVVRLEPLAVPSPQQRSPQDVAPYPVVQLFRERAQAASGDFEIDEANAGPVGDLCRDLDGLPLAVELAASQADWLTPQQMLDRLPELVEPLAKSVATSTMTLDAATERLFAELAAFSGGCLAEAAERVCGGGSERRLRDLLRVSLLKSEASGNAHRFVMLRPIREQAAALLQQQFDQPGVWGRHAAYYTELAERAEPRLESRDQEEQLRVVEAEHGNFRGVLQRALDRSIDLELGLRLAGALGPAWYVRGAFNLARHWLTGLLAVDAPVAPAVRAKALVLAGIVAYHQCDYGEGRRLLEQGLDLFRSLDDAPGTTELLAQMNLPHRDAGVAKALNGLGFVAKELGEYDESVALYEQSLDLYRGIKHEWGMSWTATDAALALLCLAHTNADRAVALLRESLDHHESGTGQPSNHALTLLYLAYARLAQGLEDQATSLTDDALERSRALGYGRGVSLSAHFRGLLHLRAGQPADAVRLLVESLRERDAEGDRAGVAEALDGLAAARAAADDVQGAIRLLGCADRAWGPVGGRRTHPEYATAAAVVEAHVAELHAAGVPEAAVTGRGVSVEDVLRELDPAGA